MAEEGEGLQEYSLVTAAGQTQKTSEGYSGDGTATYPNGDVYHGPFVNGVSTRTPVSFE